MIALGLIDYQHADADSRSVLPVHEPPDATFEPAPDTTLDLSGDPLEAFDSESEDPEIYTAPISTPSHIQPSPAGRRTWWVMLALVAATGVAAVAVVPRVTGSLLTVSPPPIIGPGLVYVESEPTGAEVWMNGMSLGLTPLRLSIADGHGVLELRHAGVVRRVPLSVERGQTLRHRVEFVDVPSSDVPVATVALAEPVPTAARPTTVSPPPVPSTALYPITRLQPAAVAESATTTAGTGSSEAAPAGADEVR